MGFADRVKSWKAKRQAAGVRRQAAHIERRRWALVERVIGPSETRLITTPAFRLAIRLMSSSLRGPQPRVRLVASSASRPVLPPARGARRVSVKEFVVVSEHVLPGVSPRLQRGAIVMLAGGPIAKTMRAHHLGRRLAPPPNSPPRRRPPTQHNATRRACKSG
jgi:hypothetical protein